MTAVSSRLNSNRSEAIRRGLLVCAWGISAHAEHGQHFMLHHMTSSCMTVPLTATGLRATQRAAPWRLAGAVPQRWVCGTDGWPMFIPMFTPGLTPIFTPWCCTSTVGWGAWGGWQCTNDDSDHM